MKIKTFTPFSLFLCLFLTLFSNIGNAQISLDPNKGWLDTEMTVEISGTNTTFISASTTCGALTADKIMFHQGMTNFSPSSVNLLNDELLYTDVDIPDNIPTGLYDVILWEGQGNCVVSCQDCFEVFEPSKIIEVTPDKETINTLNIDVTITADNSCFTQGSSTCQVNTGNVRFEQSGAGAASFNPNAVTIVNDKTIIANIDLPPSTVVGDYNVVVAEGYPCEATCSDCFEVLPSPFLELITGNQGTQGNDTTVNLQVFFADISACGYTPVTVFLELNGYVITPTNVMINGQMITMDVSIPADAPIGDYDIVVGNGLGDPCEYICEGCFRVDVNVGTIDPVFENSLLVYPNPNNGDFVIATEHTIFSCCLEIFDTAGKLVVKERMGKMNSLPVSLDNKGMYIIKLVTQDATMIQRIVVD